MSNYLKMPKKSQVVALLEFGWSDRRIEAETGVRRETVSGYDRARGANAAKTFPGSAPRLRFAAATYRTAITEKLDAGLSLQRIWQDLVEEYGYGASYESVKRFVRTIAPTRRAVGVFHCAPGAEGQVDFFCGAPTLDAATGEWRRPWVFRMTLGHSRHGYEEARLGSEARDVSPAARARLSRSRWRAAGCQARQSQGGGRAGLLLRSG
ncbi:MAG: hypothetical protein ACRD2A_00610 [Vicinamibacterales bacterium]